jgi:hypothetical protein
MQYKLSGILVLLNYNKHLLGCGAANHISEINFSVALKANVYSGNWHM